MMRIVRKALPSIAAALAFTSSPPFAVAEPPAPAPSNAAQDPDNDQFRKLLEARTRYQAIADGGGWPALPDGDPIKPGERHDCARVQALQKRLEVEGYREAPAGAEAAAPTGEAEGCEFGPGLAAAVKDFQHDRYLTSDGIVGGQTQRRLARPVEDVLAKIDFALKRWRANAANLSGSYIVVNIPAFELAVYEGPSEVLRMPVIVGLPDWQTPEMSDKVDSIVVHPSWNIPKSIASAEVLPKSRKDRGYLEREGIVSEGGTLRQKPGPRNPLGRLKFMMPNREDIYLHDTPHKQKFSAPARAFSHGCVRVEKPLELAALLLKNDPAWPQGAIQSAIDAKETKSIKLATPIAVHLLYIPAVVAGDGRLRVAPDVYDKIGNASDERAALEPAPTEENEFLGAYP